MSYSNSMQIIISCSIYIKNEYKYVKSYLKNLNFNISIESDFQTNQSLQKAILMPISIFLKIKFIDNK